MRLWFCGGTDTVTGSQHILEANGKRVLRDCGLFQGKRKESREINESFLFPVNSLESVLLSHAHIDHCGNLPSLAAQGYRGKIHATTATAALARVMMMDSAKIQEQDAAYLNQKTNRKGQEPVIPLYTRENAQVASDCFQGHRYGDTIELAPGQRFTSYEAGHILGSALHLAEVEEKGRTVRVGYAVDLGRKNLPLIRDPELLPRPEVLVIESTYGDRLHDPATDAAGELGTVVSRIIERGGKVYIPAFALERAQEIVFHLAQLRMSGRIPNVPVYVDSPMAKDVSRIFDQSQDYFDEESRDVMREIGCLLCAPWVHYTGSVDESKEVTAKKEPCIIIAGSGMCEHGRILHHLKNGIENPKNGIVLVGYQAENTLGRRLADQEIEVKIFGDFFQRKAEVTKLDAFSAHADRTELLAYVQAVKPEKIFLVHGETKQRQAFAQTLKDVGFAHVYLPKRGDHVEI